MTPQIFVSYARSDQEQVFPIVEKLREKGLQLWIDHEGIHGAKLWSQEIVHAIEGCKVFILFASSTAFQSQNVTKELALASESGKHILPVFIEDAQVPTAMKYQLAGIQHLIHQKGQTQQTIDNILRTLSNLDIESGEAPVPAPAVSHAPLRAKQASKAPLAIAALVALLAVLAFFLFKGDKSTVPDQSPATAKVHKSTTDLCVVTVHGSDAGEVVSGENRELRDELNSKLSRFKDYKVILAKAVSPDATTQELLDMAKGMNADFILHATTDSEKKRINAKVMNAADGRTFWSKTVRENDVEREGDFIDEASGLIAAHIAGHDGAIHRDILKKALVKKEEDLTAMELLQLGKAVWEEQTEDVTVKGTEYLERCIELNPDISTAHAILSEVYLEDIRGEYNRVPDAMTKAKASISRAIELNPSNAIALIEQIWISWYEKDFTACKLQAEAALKANPYEPLVLVSVGSFYLTTGIDLELGKKYNDLALRYNETPQGWYYVGYVNYYLTYNEYDKALESALKSWVNNSSQHATAAALYWLNGEKEIAQKHYKQLIVMEPDFTLEKLKKRQEVWSRAKVSKDLIQKAFKEVVDAFRYEAGTTVPSGNNESATIRTFKSTTDLCLVTVFEFESTKGVSEGNRELRDELNSKLSRFKDYKVILAKAVSPDATTQELLDMAKGVNADFILHATTDSEKIRISAKVMNAADGRTFWSKTVRENDVEGEGDFIDEATGMIAAHIAGYDGAIHRDILAKALVKKEDDLTPMELLQLGKAAWEEQTENVTVKGTGYLEKCIEWSPDISTAHAMLGEVYLEDIRREYNRVPDAMSKAKASISRAIELSPSNAIALIGPAMIFLYEKDFTACKLQAEAALKANPYEPLVLASVGSFYLSTGIDLELGKKYNDLALRYNETPQSWYYYGYVNYYLTNNDYGKALDYILKSGVKNSSQHSKAAALYWLNGEKEIAQKYYKQLIVMEPDFTLEKLKKYQEVWSDAKVSRDLLQKAFKEVVDASKSKDAVE